MIFIFFCSRWWYRVQKITHPTRFGNLQRKLFLVKYKLAGPRGLKIFEFFVPVPSSNLPNWQVKSFCFALFLVNSLGFSAANRTKNIWKSWSSHRVVAPNLTGVIFGLDTFRFILAVVVLVPFISNHSGWFVLQFPYWVYNVQSLAATTFVWHCKSFASHQYAASCYCLRMFLSICPTPLLQSSHCLRFWQFDCISFGSIKTFLKSFIFEIIFHCKFPSWIVFTPLQLFETFRSKTVYCFHPFSRWRFNVFHTVFLLRYRDT